MGFSFPVSQYNAIRTGFLQPSSFRLFHSAIEGNTGVFFIKVISINTKPQPPAAVAQQQRSMKANQVMQAALGKSFEALKKIADVKDKRRKFF